MFPDTPGAQETLRQWGDNDTELGRGCARVGAPGSPFEIVEDDSGNRRYKHAPPNLRSVFDIARGGGDEIFLVFEDERWSFNDVFAQVDALGDALVNRYGIGKGDRVAVGMRNYPEWVMSMLAIISVGGVSVSLNALWVEDEIDYALADSGASLLIADVERIERSIEPMPTAGCSHARSARSVTIGTTMSTSGTRSSCREQPCRRSTSAGTTTQPFSTPPARPGARRVLSRPTAQSSRR